MKFYKNVEALYFEFNNLFNKVIEEYSTKNKKDIDKYLLYQSLVEYVSNTKQEEILSGILCNLDIIISEKELLDYLEKNSIEKEK